MRNRRTRHLHAAARRVHGVHGEASVGPSITPSVCVRTARMWARRTDSMLRAPVGPPTLGRPQGFGVDFEDAAFVENRRAFDDVFELAHVARPVVRRQQPQAAPAANPNCLLWPCREQAGQVSPLS